MLPTGLIFPGQMLLCAALGLDLAAACLLLAFYSGLTVLLELRTGGLADLLGRRPTLLVSAITFACSALCRARLVAPVLITGVAGQPRHSQRATEDTGL